MLRGLTVVVVAGVALCGCGERAPTKGDIVATVNGRDITTSDLDAEARARGVRFDAPDGEAARAAVLNYVVGRTMLVDKVAKEHLENNPRLLADRRRVDDDLLAKIEVTKLMAQAPAITPQAVDAFRAANPQMFAGRQKMTVNEVQVRPEGPLPQGGRETMGDLIAQMHALSLPTQQSRVVVDTLTLPKMVVDSLSQHPDLPVRVDNGRIAVFLTLVSSKPDPAPEAEQRQIAMQALQAKWLDGRIAAEAAGMRKEGLITYRPGYTPKP